ncbi:baseplate J/gp47 family protein [Halocatena marina]|uniref:Baseplate J/gp47 family protein n=1 Tax=Halocatena marina TaxID=2934937 RepID=A0ABD5YRH6_9EURY|nr:baseplate J/gp47 family protein [Halocatena marina]
MAIINGRYEPLSKEEILDILMDYAETEFGPDVNPDDLSIIRTFYSPVAELLADIQLDLREVLNATQLEYAEDKALDLLTALIGVRRKEAEPAIGTATFSRSQAASTDYVVPANTTIQTDSNDPIRYVTTESATLLSGNTEVTSVPIEAVEPGIEGNVGPNTIVVMPDPPTGIESVTNPSATDSGEKRENDTNLRERAKDELSDGMNATAKGVYNAINKTDGVKSVSLFVNDTNTQDSDGRPGNSFEAVVECLAAVEQNVADTIWFTKAAGDGTVGGKRGSLISKTVATQTGQTKTVEFSAPTTKLVYLDITLATNQYYEGDAMVKDAIVRYLGGTLTSGDEEDGELRVGDDVVYTRLIEEIMKINGIDDIPTLNIGFTSSPTGTSNLSLSANEMATSDATDSSISITIQ